MAYGSFNIGLIREGLMNSQFRSAGQSILRRVRQAVLSLTQCCFPRLRPFLLGAFCTVLLTLSFVAPAQAGLTDDHFDGNIFPLYAGNGSIVPPKFTLAESLKRERPIILVFYVDDSSDCKAYASTLSQVDRFYGWAADIIALSSDMIPIKDHYEPNEPGYYYKGYVPQTVLFDKSGKVVLDVKGAVPFEQVDDALRVVFDLLPRSESVELKRRQLNEVTTELVEQEKGK